MSAAVALSALALVLPPPLVGTWTRTVTAADDAREHHPGTVLATWRLVLRPNGNALLYAEAGGTPDFTTRFTVSGGALTIGSIPIYVRGQLRLADRRRQARDLRRGDERYPLPPPPRALHRRLDQVPLTTGARPRLETPAAS